MDANTPPQLSADATPGPGGGKPFKRSWKNYLIDTKMQLRLSIYVAVVVMGIGATFGWMYVRAQEEASLVAAMDNPDFDAEIQEALAAEDRKKAILLFGALTLVALGLSISAIKLTHKVAGPAFVIARHSRALARGRIPFVRALRSSDWLQDLGHDFKAAVDALKAREEHEIGRLEAILGSLPEASPARGPLQDLLAEKREKLRESPEKSSPDLKRMK